MRRLSRCSQKQDGSDALVLSTLPNFSHFGSNQSRENIVLWRFLGFNWLFRSHACHLQPSTVFLSSSHACVVLSSTCDFSFLSVSPLTQAPAVHAALIGPSESSLLCSALIIFTFLHRVISLKLWSQLNLRAPSRGDDEGLCCLVLVLEGSVMGSSAPHHYSLPQWLTANRWLDTALLFLEGEIILFSQLRSKWL